jgi:biopolymer transport protein TolR
MAAPIRRQKSQAVMSEINVTPFVDVMLVLLIIFMVTAPMMSQGIDVNLPKTASSGMSVTEDPFIIFVKANQKIEIGETSVELSQLKSKLSAIFETRKNKQVYLQADRKADYGIVAEVIAEIRAAGIFNVSLVTLVKE